jgi:hypothetical protein
VRGRETSRRQLPERLDRIGLRVPTQRVVMGAAKSPNDKARAERVVATLTRLRSVSNVNTIQQELATLARGDARHERTDQSNEHHEAFLAIQALRKGLATAPGLASTAASADDQTLWQDAISKASTAASADVQTCWDDAIAKAQIWPVLGQSPAVDNLKNQYEKCARRAYLAEEVTGQFVKPDAAADRVLYACRSEDNALHSLLETSLSNDSMARIVMDKFRRRLKNDLMELFNELNIRNGVFPR